MRDIQIIGDIPIYVSHNSADVWANPENFALDPETYEVTQMAGVPPDYFSATGQLWGNPVYDWEYLKKPTLLGGLIGFDFYIVMWILFASITFAALSHFGKSPQVKQLLLMANGSLL